MKQKDAVGLDTVQNRLGHLPGIPALPVSGIHGPLHHGHVKIRPLRHLAVRGPQPVFPFPQQRLQRRIRPGHLLGRRIREHAVQPLVAPGMVANLVALLRHPGHEIGVILNLLADEKEGSPGPPLLQAVQQTLRSTPSGAVVKGQGHIFTPRRNLRSAFCRHRISARQAQCGQDCQQKNRNYFFYHRATPPYFFEVSMRRMQLIFLGKITKSKSPLS